jgi:NAD dependent epimerase/dehydratase
MKNVLVTGADGFIGSHLAETLLRRGYNVRAMVLYNSFDSWGWLDDSPREIRDALEVVAGDVRDSGFVRSVMKGQDAVMHLAALIAIPYSYVAPQSYVDVNVTGTLNVVAAARDLGTAKVLHTSTSECYGTAQFVPITEAHPLVGQSPYAASKIGADQIALSFFRSFEVPVTVVRPFNTYGPRQSARAVIPTTITQIAAGKREIELGSLSPTRDFSFVQDTVDGMVAILEAPVTAGETINLGSGHEISIGDLVTLIGSVMNKPVTVVSRTERMRPERSEVERLLADASKAQQLTGWTPGFAGRDGLRRGLEITAEWFSQPANLARYRVGRYTV